MLINFHIKKMEIHIHSWMQKEMKHFKQLPLVHSQRIVACTMTGGVEVPLNYAVESLRMSMIRDP